LNVGPKFLVTCSFAKGSRNAGRQARNLRMYMPGQYCSTVISTGKNASEASQPLDEPRESPIVNEGLQEEPDLSEFGQTSEGPFTSSTVKLSVSRERSAWVTEIDSLPMETSDPRESALHPAHVELPGGQPESEFELDVTQDPLAEATPGRLSECTYEFFSQLPVQTAGTPDGAQLKECLKEALAQAPGPANGAALSAESKADLEDWVKNVQEHAYDP
jgi:hypothetical protein